MRLLFSNDAIPTPEVRVTANDCNGLRTYNNKEECGHEVFEDTNRHLPAETECEASKS